jgi:hypothetical protein
MGNPVSTGPETRMYSNTFTMVIDTITGLLALIGSLAFLFLIWFVCRSLNRIDDLLIELILLQKKQYRPNSTPDKR